MYITKTDFLEFLKCHKSFWLKKKKPELYIEAELSDFELSKVREGNEIEKLARTLFEGGHLVVNDQTGEQTNLLIERIESPIFQATFLEDNKYSVRSDILCYDKDSKQWNLYEVKSSASVKTDRDHNHIKDLTFQNIVIERCGIRICKSYLIHINSDYQKHGDLSVDNLFIIEDVTSLVKEISEETLLEMENALDLLSNDEIDMSSCECIYLTRNNHCPSFKVFNPGVPYYSIHDISRISKKNLKTLVDNGILDITDVPENINLSDNQRMQVNIAISGKAQIDKASITEELSKISYPLFFLDYETYCSAIPILEGYKPYQHIPFQVSIDKLKEDGQIIHYECLSDDLTNLPVDLLGFIKTVECAKCNVVSWHASFESTINRNMAKLYPQYSDMLHEMNSNTFDLENIFMSDYLHPGFRGSSSIKNVLPVIIPEFGYDNLEIQGGTAAMEHWRRLMFENISDSEKNNIRKALLEYCALDTIAMVKLYQHLVSVCV